MQNGETHIVPQVRKPLMERALHSIHSLLNATPEDRVNASPRKKPPSRYTSGYQ
jgi:hypothetical protein